MKKHIRVLSILLALVLLASLFGCAEKPLTVGPLKTMEDPEYGGMFPDISIEDFNKLGFAFGDSLDVSLSNGKVFEDIPYYSGYFNRRGERLLCGYPGYPHPDFTQNQVANSYKQLELAPEDTVTITLREKGKYLDVQNALNTTYSNDPADYAGDVEFANFRSLSGGKIVPDRFFRSASPCNNQHNRAPAVNRMMAQYGVQCVLDLADNPEKIGGFLADSSLDIPVFRQIFEAGNVIPAKVTPSFSDETFRKTVTEGLKVLIQKEGPYLIHCNEGKDRTGFLCVLLEALAGATMEEMEADYMETYDMYFGITKESNPTAYNAFRDIRFMDMLLFLTDTKTAEECAKADFAAGARAYLLQGGMTDSDVDALTALLTK